MKFKKQTNCIVCDKPTTHALCPACLARAKNAHALREERPARVWVTLAIGKWDNTWYTLDFTVPAPPDGVPEDAATEAAITRWREITDESVDDVAFVVGYAYSDAL